ncbi:MAG: hypothetical protein JO069_06945 [Verrucomicrobia bacterium]|nr:hypothetical protein [Verrucomicrobiota bacterium]
MGEQLIRFLRLQPFVPFTVTLKGGDAYAIETVERMSVGQHVCSIVDPQGLTLYVPLGSILHVSTKDTPEALR